MDCYALPDDGDERWFGTGDGGSVIEKSEEGAWRCGELDQGGGL